MWLLENGLLTALPENSTVYITYLFRVQAILGKESGANLQRYLDTYKCSCLTRALSTLH